MSAGVVANPDFATTIRNVPITIAVLNNDTFTDLTSLSVSIAPGMPGTPVVNADNTVTFTPDFNDVGARQFDYTITTSTGSDTATVLITVSPTPAELYANYLQDVSLADQQYWADVSAAATTRQGTDATLANGAAQSYVDYKSAFNTATQGYQTAHDAAVTAYGIALGEANDTVISRRQSAYVIYQAATSSPQADLDSALAAANTVFQQQTDDAFLTYSSTLLPYHGQRA